MKKTIIISTPRKAIDHLNKIRAELEQIKADKFAHEQNKLNTPASLSLVDYMNSKGMNSHFAVRHELSKQFGMKEYHGTTEHNKRLLAILQSKHGELNTPANG